MTKPKDCPIINDRRHDDGWRASVDAKLAETAEAIRLHAKKHDDLSAAVKLNNAQTQEMFDIFSPVKQVFLLIGKIYDWSLWIFNGIAKILKPILFIAAFVVAVGLYIKTGRWEWPS